MYLREMGSVELLSREGEIAIAKRIEAGREAMIAGLCESPLTFQAIILWRDELKDEKIHLRDIVDLEATYATPEDEKKMLAEAEKAEEAEDVEASEDEDDDFDDDAPSMSRMEEELRPKVLETLDEIAKLYKSLRKLQEQEIIEGKRLSDSQAKRAKTLRNKIIALVKSLHLNNARICCSQGI
jgi:RNA polymerase primary sigma factor